MSSPKKILVITDNKPDQINGVVTTFRNLDRLALQDGHVMIFIDPTLFKSIPMPGYPEVAMAMPYKIGHKIIEIDPDYIHIATEGPVGLAAKLWLDKHKWRYNTSYHTKFPEFLRKIYHVPTSITYGYLRWFHKHSGRVLTTTETMVKELKDHGFKGDIVSWTRGVDRDIFNTSYRKPKDNLTLLCVSRISKEKNMDAFCELRYDNAKKIVVGDGPYLEELKEKYPNVEYVGVKTGNELASYYANADVFIFPSRADTFGIVMIEALACGTPVAAYPVTGPIDVVEQNETGFLDENLNTAIDNCLTLDRDVVYVKSFKWSWENCWKIFKNNLVAV
jgi:glycosyltransferase involved in cell wall biosynthesis